VPRTASTRSLAGTIDKRDVDDGDTLRSCAERRVRDEYRSARRIFDPHPLVVRRGEVAILSEHDRDHMLQADVRHAIVHDCAGILRRER
jgi:hypothetical protein